MCVLFSGYWAKRRERIRPPVGPAPWHLLRRQQGRCPLCRGLLLYASHEPHDEREWEQGHTTIRKALLTGDIGHRPGLPQPAPPTTNA